KTTASSKEDFESGTAPDAEAPTPPPGPPTRRRPLTAVQPDLDRGGHGRVERRLLPAAVAQALQQPLRPALHRPEHPHRRSPSAPRFPCCRANCPSRLPFSTSCNSRWAICNRK